MIRSSFVWTALKSTRSPVLNTCIMCESVAFYVQFTQLIDIFVFSITFQPYIFSDYFLNYQNNKKIGQYLELNSRPSKWKRKVDLTATCLWGSRTTLGELQFSYKFCGSISDVKWENFCSLCPNIYIEENCKFISVFEF